MTNSFENIGQDVEIEPVDSLKCYLVIAGKRITEFNGETCYMDAQRMGLDILMKRIYGNN
jgi:glycerol-3-phosphate cytidylyltransferase-like family protein